jgi:hypothetical protein
VFGYFIDASCHRVNYQSHIKIRLAGKTVRQIGQRYQAGGLERALFDAPRPGSAPALNPLFQ